MWLAEVLSQGAPPAVGVFGCHGDVCSESPSSTTGSAHPRRPCPRLEALGSCGHSRVGGGHGLGQQPHAACPHTLCQVAGPRRNWRLSGARERLNKKEKKFAGLVESSEVSLAPSRRNYEAEGRPGSVSTPQAIIGPESKLLFIL